MIAVADTTPLIYLAKINRLDLLSAYDEVLIPGEVYKEAVENGLKKGFLDARTIQEEIGKGAITLRELRMGEKTEALKLIEFAEIEKGEAEAIVLAKTLKADLIIDDAAAHGVARTYGIESLWTTSLVLKHVGEGKLSKKEAKKIIERLVESGYRISEDVLVELLRKLE